MKLIQLNIWGGKLKFQILDFLTAEQPDIVCMQEVNDLPGPAGALFATLDEIKQAGNFEDLAMSPVCSYAYMNRQSLYGNATLSRLPIIDFRTVFTNGQYKDGFDATTDDDNSRNFQHAIIKAGTANIHVLNYHGYFVAGSKDGNQETMRQVQLLADYLKSLTGPVILAGDFNLAPTSPSITILDNLLTNLSSQHKLTNTYTQLSIHKVVCDYIFVNDAVKVSKFSASEQLVSDHKALILEFEV